MAGQTDEELSLEGLRARVAALEARRDGLLAHLEALDDDIPPPPLSSSDADGGPPPKPWTWRIGYYRWIPAMLPLALLALALDGLPRFVCGVIAGVLAVTGVWLTVRPARIRLDEHGLEVRHLGFPQRYPWSDVTDVRFARALGKVRIEVGGMWRVHNFGFPSEAQDLEAQRRIRRWIDAHSEDR